MDIKDSIRKLIKQSTELLRKLEDDEDIDESSVEIFDKIIDDSKNISTKIKSKRSKSSLHNGNKSSSSGDDSKPATIKLVPIEKLIHKRATIVLEKTCIELSDSDNEMLVRSDPKPKSCDTDKTKTKKKTSKASILKSVFSPSKETSTSKNHQNTNLSTARMRSCRVNLKRIDLNRLVVSNGPVIMPTTVNDRPTTESSKTVRFNFLFHSIQVCPVI